MPGDGYIYYSSIIVKTDVITGLMNRQSYEGRIPYVSVGYSRFDPDKNVKNKKKVDKKIIL